MMILGFIAWVKALCVVSIPFIKIAALWVCYQLGIGYIAWATARFYSTHCAGPGLNGFVSSLFTMGSPICISAWISHAAFVAIYVTAFVAAVVFGVMWIWKRMTNDKIIKNLYDEINHLNRKLHRSTRRGGEGPAQSNNTSVHHGSQVLPPPNDARDFSWDKDKCLRQRFPGLSHLYGQQDQ